MMSIAEDLDHSSDARSIPIVCSKNNSPDHKSDDNKTPPFVRKSFLSQVTVCSRISRNKMNCCVTEIKPMSATNRRSKGYRILTQDLLERIEKTEFTTTAARKDLGPGPTERENLLSRLNKTDFKLKQLICSKRSNTNPNSSAKLEGLTPNDSKDESDLITPAKTNSDKSLFESFFTSRSLGSDDHQNSPGEMSSEGTIRDSVDGSVMVLPKKYKIPHSARLEIRKPSISGISQLSRQMTSQMSDSKDRGTPKYGFS